MVRPRHFAGALLAVTACTSKPSVSLTDYDADAVKARCKRLVRCGVFADQLTCTGFFRKIPNTDLAAALTDGKVHYDGEAAASCNAALAAASCDSTTRDARALPDPCAHIYNGTIAPGDSCEIDEECKSARCVKTTACDPSMCCPGTCSDLALAAIGDACQVTADCVTDAFCGQDLLCHALGHDGATCYDDVDCDYGLGCVGAGIPGLCHPLGTLGGACPDLRCADIGATCSSAMTCVMVGLPGAACSVDLDCSPDARCDTAAGQCADVPSLGMACSGRCSGEAFCYTSGTGSTCIAPLATTMPCDTDDNCATYFCEDGPVFSACADRPRCD